MICRVSKKSLFLNKIESSFPRVTGQQSDYDCFVLNYQKNHCFFKRLPSHVSGVTD